MSFSIDALLSNHVSQKPVSKVSSKEQKDGGPRRSPTVCSSKTPSRKEPPRSPCSSPRPSSSGSSHRCASSPESSVSPSNSLNFSTGSFIPRPGLLNPQHPGSVIPPNHLHGLFPAHQMYGYGSQPGHPMLPVLPQNCALSLNVIENQTSSLLMGMFGNLIRTHLNKYVTFL